MLPRENRLTKKKEFDRVLKKGESVQSRSFGLFFIKEDDFAPSRFGIVISNKISRLANKRNRAKRVLREIIRNLLGGGRAGEGFSFVILCRKNIIGKSQKELEIELKSALGKAGALKEN